MSLLVKLIVGALIVVILAAVAGVLALQGRLVTVGVVGLALAWGLSIVVSEARKGTG